VEIPVRAWYWSLKVAKCLVIILNGREVRLYRAEPMGGWGGGRRDP